MNSIYLILSLSFIIIPLKSFGSPHFSQLNPKLQQLFWQRYTSWSVNHFTTITPKPASNDYVFSGHKELKISTILFPLNKLKNEGLYLLCTLEKNTEICMDMEFTWEPTQCPKKLTILGNSTYPSPPDKCFKTEDYIKVELNSPRPILFDKIAKYIVNLHTSEFSLPPSGLIWKQDKTQFYLYY